MDGNGRWAKARGLPRPIGHLAGARAIGAVVEKAPSLGIGTLTLFAFSADNWRRPPGDVGGLMRLFALYLKRSTIWAAARGIRLRVIGRRDRLPRRVVAAIEAAEAATAGGDGLLLRVAIDYSARAAIVEAARRFATDPETGDFATQVAGAGGGEVDLMIRTGGEQRLSDFLLWESAYAEFWFTERLWPDFTPADLEDAVNAFRRRDRRFGGVSDRVGTGG